MGEVDAPYPSTVTDIFDNALVSGSFDGSDLVLTKGDGGDILNANIKHPASFFEKVRRRVGNRANGYREIVLKEFHRPGLVNEVLSTPSTSAKPTAIAWTLDSRYVAAPKLSSPYLNVFSKRGTTFATEASDTPVTFTGAADISPDGKFLLLGHSGSDPNVIVFSATGEGPPVVEEDSYLAFDILPSLAVVALKFSPTGEFLVLGHLSTPFFTMYKQTGLGNFTKITPITGGSAPASAVRSVAWSADTTYLYLGLHSSPFLAWYKRNGDGFTKLTNPSSLPSASAMSSEWSPGDSRYLAVSGSAANTTGLSLYRRTGDTLVKKTNPSGTPTNVSALSWSPDGKILALGELETSLVHIFKVDEESDTFTKVNVLTLPASGHVEKLAFSPDGMVLSASSTAAPYLVHFKSALGPIRGAAIRIDEGHPSSEGLF